MEQEDKCSCCHNEIEKFGIRMELCDKCKICSKCIKNIEEYLSKTDCLMCMMKYNKNEK